MSNRIQFRRDTVARWKSINPILSEAELGIETDTRYTKIGDGVTAWNDLPYATVFHNITHELGTSENLVLSQKGANTALQNLKETLQESDAKLEELIEGHESDITNLSNQIKTEQENRIKQVNNEAALRTNADTALGNRIDEEVATLEGSINNTLSTLNKRTANVLNVNQLANHDDAFAMLQEAAQALYNANGKPEKGALITYRSPESWLWYRFEEMLHSNPTPAPAAEGGASVNALPMVDTIPWKYLCTDEELKKLRSVVLKKELKVATQKVGDTTIQVADAADTAVQEWVPAESRTTCAAMLTALAEDGGYFEGGLPILIARNEDGTIAEMMVYDKAGIGGDSYYDIANYIPLSLASLAGSKQAKLKDTADVTIGGEQNNTLTLTDTARRAVFDDLWLQAVRAAGRIDYTDAAAPYVCNGIHHTYEEAKYLYDQGHPRHGCLANFYKSCPIKTNLPPHLSAIDGGTYMFSGCSSLTKVNMSLLLPLLATFANCTSLKYIECYSPVAQTGNIDSVYLNCSALQTIEVRTVFPRDFDVADSPLLDLTTFQGFVSKYNGSKAITIYVHPTVYAKLTDTSNTQWYAVMTQAVNKKIAFATKE